MQVDIEVQRASGASGLPDDSQFQLWAEAVPFDFAGICVLTIRLVDEHEARRFNRDYRNRDYATNVLSFAADLPVELPAEIRQSTLGDLLICAPLVASEAVERDRSEMDHWAHLTVHGILHLMGYDHERADEAAKMESMEKNILAGLGISDPYEDIA